MPTQFVKIVFIAVIRKQLDIYQAKALCDLYHANYDLVRSAWEVYTVQDDATDLIDTLRRVVKDLTLDEDDNHEGMESSDDSIPNKPTSTATSSTNTGNGATTGNTKATQHTNNTTTSTTATAQAQAAYDRKQEALAAVSQAKRELLKHSLEMMVKQSIISGDSAAELYKRYLQGDTLAEAAIDAYAADRNVAEFLDTLQILANHTPTELSNMMKDVAEEAAENAISSSPTAVNTRLNAAISPKASATNVLNSTTTSKTTTIPVNVATAQMQLKGITAELARNQMISAEVHSILNRLISEADHRLIVAYEKYTTTQEGAKLIDTLLHVAAAEIALQSAPVMFVYILYIHYYYNLLF